MSVAEPEEPNDDKEVNNAPWVRLKVQDKVVCIAEWDGRNDEDAGNIMQEKTR
jgi:hypothetical protein